MFQNWIKFLHLKSAGSALKCSETQVRVGISTHFLTKFVSFSNIIRYLV